MIIGSGMGGGTLAWALRDSASTSWSSSGAGFCPVSRRTPPGPDVHPQALHDRRALVRRRHRRAVQPGVYYWVGGNTKFYGACLPRFRRSDFEEVQHQDGVSKAWPFSYDDLEPYYGQAEQLYRGARGVGEDPTEPPHSSGYPFPPLEHEPTIERLADALRSPGPAPLPHVQRHEPRHPGGPARRYHLGRLPYPPGRKTEAENRAVVPALRSGQRQDC